MSTITSSPTASAPAGQFRYQITADNQPVSFTATGLPGGLQVYQGGVISGPVSPGTYSIGLSATNASGDTATGTLTLAATQPPPTSVAPIESDVVFRVRQVDEAGNDVPLPGSPAAPAQMATPVAVQNNESGASVTTNSAVVLAANGARLNASFVNYGATGCFLSLAGSATAGKGIYLSPNGGSYTIDAGNLYRGPISAVAATGTTTLTVQEGQ